MSEPTLSLPIRVATVADDAYRAELERITTGELDAVDELHERYRTVAYSIAYRTNCDPR